MNEKTILKYIHSISQRTGFSATGADAAVLGDIVVSTDQFIEGTHFTWEQMAPEAIGAKAVIQALSDLAASASPPLAVLCSAAWPPAQEERIRKVFTGIESACLAYGVPLIGGDVSSSPALTYLDIVVIGKNRGVPGKAGAQPGDLVAVTGKLGSAAGGWHSLKFNKNYPELISAFTSPVAQINVACALGASSFLTALTDLSDSLGKSLHDISENSGCGMTIDWNKIPIHQELRELCASENLSLQDFVLYGGEDYHLLMTLKPSTSEKLISDHGLNVIGKVISDREITYIDAGKKAPITWAGWDPFVL